MEAKEGQYMCESGRFLTSLSAASSCMLSPSAAARCGQIVERLCRRLFMWIMQRLAISTCEKYKRGVKCVTLSHGLNWSDCLCPRGNVWPNKLCVGTIPPTKYAHLRVSWCYARLMAHWLTVASGHANSFRFICWGFECRHINAMRGTGIAFVGLQTLKNDFETHHSSLSF